VLDRSSYATSYIDGYCWATGSRSQVLPLASSTSLVKSEATPASMFSFRLCAAASDRKRFRLLRALLVHSLLHIIDGSRKTRATRRSTEIATTRMDVHGPHFGSERKGSSVYDHRGDHVTVPSRPAWILHRGTRDGRVDIDNYVQRHIDASRTEQAKRRHHAAAAHNRTMRIDAGLGPRARRPRVCRDATGHKPPARSVLLLRVPLVRDWGSVGGGLPELVRRALDREAQSAANVTAGCQLGCVGVVVPAVNAVSKSTGPAKRPAFSRLRWSGAELAGDDRLQFEPAQHWASSSLLVGGSSTLCNRRIARIN